MKDYEELRLILDTHISRAPASPYLSEILEILFPKGDIDVALGLSFRAKNVVEISADLDLPVEEVTSRLEAMVNRAVIHRREKNGEMLFSLLPVIPGLFEFPYMKNDGSLDLDHLGELWEKYHHDAMSVAFSGNPTPAMRVFPVEASLKENSQVIVYEEARKIIEKADFIAVTRCACRASLNRCDGPLEVCLTFGGIARFLTGLNSARKINHDEAIEILKKSDEAGLVHNVENHQDRPGIICNCCSCCCTILRGKTELHHPHAFAPSSYSARIDEDACTGCLVCADERCPVGAISTDGTVQVDEAECIGCGLCVSACPAEAISMVTRKDAPVPPENVMEMGKQIMIEKGILEKFIGKGRK